MDSEEECAEAVIIDVVSKRRKDRKKRRKRKIWVKPWLRRSNYLGIYNTPVQETEDRFEYSKFLRMLPENFEELLYLLTESIEKERTVLRDLW